VAAVCYNATAKQAIYDLYTLSTNIIWSSVVGPICNELNDINGYCGYILILLYTF